MLCLARLLMPVAAGVSLMYVPRHLLQDSDALAEVASAGESGDKCRSAIDHYSSVTDGCSGGGCVCCPAVCMPADDRLQSVCMLQGVT